MKLNQSIIKVIRQRYSCRTYQKKEIQKDIHKQLSDYASSSQVGPLGTASRFKMIAATDGDSKSLRGLGTYGFIKNAAGFIVGATKDAPNYLEDFGYLMEKFILYATDLGLGTCWLGGSFTRSRFSKKISAGKNEIIPSVTSVGYISGRPRVFDKIIRQEASSDRRRPWNWLFFDGEFGKSLTEQAAGDYATPLEMVRLGPSASNLQPWRLIKDENAWHFYLHRKLGYRDSSAAKFLKTADLQRVDMGIAMCHFELTAKELGFLGYWNVDDPGIQKPDALTEYTASWIT